MRRVLSVILCILIVFSFGACTGKQTFNLDEFERDISFQSTDITVKGKLYYKNKDEMSFTVKEPENISGMVFTFNEISQGEVRIDYGKAAQDSPINILLSILCDAAQEEILLPLKGEYTYTGEASSAEYKIIFNCEKCEIIRIEAEKYIYKFE